MAAAPSEERPRKRPRSGSPAVPTLSHTGPSNGDGHAPPQPPPSAPPLVQVPPPVDWDPSFFGVEPVDEFTSQVAEWLYGHCRGRDHVEIEAKIGILSPSSGGGGRLDFPVTTETILREPSSTRFESNMSLRQHAAYNQLLNGRVDEQGKPGWRGSALRYKHLREIDRSYPEVKGQRGRRRVTFDQQSGRLKPGSSIVKSRVADLNVYSPARLFDFRISVNIEEPVEAPAVAHQSERHKDRLSYQYDMFKIDLTQVADGTPTAPKRHELEIEFLRPDILVYEGDQFYAGQENAFHYMVQIFLNNIRMLIRNAAPPG